MCPIVALPRSGRRRGGRYRGGSGARLVPRPPGRGAVSVLERDLLDGVDRSRLVDVASAAKCSIGTTAPAYAPHVTA